MTQTCGCPCTGTTGGLFGNNSFAVILVLFILLAIIGTLIW